MEIVNHIKQEREEDRTNKIQAEDSKARKNYLEIIKLILQF